VRKSTFYFLEPSKVGNQHITVISGFISAITASEYLCEKFNLFVGLSRRTISALDDRKKSGIEIREVPVMDPEKRRLVVKSLLEFVLVFRWILRLRQGDILFVSCMLPTSLFLLEIFGRFFRYGSVFVVLHGELEGIVGEARQDYRRIGYWAAKWAAFRKKSSNISVVVLDDFIKEQLISRRPENFDETSVHVVYLPLNLLEGERNQSVSCNETRVCFIGYRTAQKRFSDFERLSEFYPQFDFLSIGGGFVEDLSNGKTLELSAREDFLNEVGKCDYSIFPYASGYELSLSAAMLDAISVGTHVVALDVPCAKGLYDYFGAEYVTVYGSFSDLEEDFVNLVSSRGKTQGMSRKELGVSLRQSKFGQLSVERKFCDLIKSISS